jgi:hypothetical protein
MPGREAWMLGLEPTTCRVTGRKRRIVAATLN